MRNFFSINRNQTTILITLLSVVLLGAFYLFVYIPGNEKILAEQRFRTLQHLDKNIHEKINNSTALLNTLLTAYMDTANDNDKVKKYIEDYSTKNFTLFPIKDSVPKKKSASTKKSFFDGGTDGATDMIKINDAEKQFNLKVCRREKDSSISCQAMQYKFDQFINPLLPENVFDDYVILTRGNVVYESFPSGMSNTKKDSLLGMHNGVAAAGIRNQQIGGVEYKMFLQPVGFDSTSEWIVAGLLSAERYSQEKNQLPAGTILILITVALVIFVAFPWIKLYLMGGKDRLTFGDYIRCFLASMLLMSLGFFVFFVWNRPLRNEEIPNAKENLAEKIKAAFTTEVGKAYSELKEYDGLIKMDTAFRRDLRKMLKDTVEFGNIYKLQNWTNTIAGKEIADLHAKRNLDINHVFWLDNKGEEIYNWETDSKNSPHGNFEKRDYFRNIRDGNFYLLDDDPAKKFYLTQLISWTTGTFRTVMSIPSLLDSNKNEKNNHIVTAALSFNIKSLDNDVMPAGYGFALTDKQGKVLYHSDKTRNLNENLTEEFSAGEELRACYAAHTENAFSTGYAGKKYAVLAQPVDDLPYFLVVFSDTGYIATRDIESYSFTLSMMFIFFLFLVIEFSVVLIASSRRSLLKKQFFITSWLWPRQSSHAQYMAASVMNCGIIILLSIFYSFATFAEFFFMLLFAVTIITIFLTALFAKKYWRNDKKENLSYKLKTIASLFVMILLMLRFAFVTLSKPGDVFFLFILAALVISILLVFFEIQVSNTVERILKNHFINKYFISNWGYAESYSLMAVTRLIVTSGIPVLFFYSASYNYEQSLTARYKQMEFSRQLIDKYPYIDCDQLENICINDSSFKMAVYSDSAWIKNITAGGLDTAALNAGSVKFTNEENFSAKLLNMFRFYSNDLAVLNNNLYQPATDASFYFNNIFEGRCVNNNGNTISTETKTPGQYLTITSHCLNYTFPYIFENFGGFLFWIILLVAIALFYLVVYNIIKKIFVIDLPKTATWNYIDDNMLLRPMPNNRLLVIGAPGCNALPYILKKLTQKKEGNHTEQYIYNEKDQENSTGSNTIYPADFTHLPALNNEHPAHWKNILLHLKSSRYKCIILNNFEYNLQDIFSNQTRLKLLEELMADNKKKIIIISSVHPAIFLNAITEYRERKNDGKPIAEYYIEKWVALLGRYDIFIKPISRANQQWEEYDVKQAIRRETQNSHCYKNMNRTIIKKLNQAENAGNIADIDAFIIKTQLTAHNYFMRIWQSLLKEEKFIVYDLAEDSLVNAHNTIFLNLLISKGIIVKKDGLLQLFSYGFRNFILTAIGEAEVTKVTSEMKDNGGWQRLKTPLWLIVIAILAFLLNSQQEMYTKIIGYAGALAAGIPAIAKIFTLFERDSSKTS